MAGKSTISITFKLDGDGKGFKDIAKDAEGLKQVLNATLQEADKLQTKVINFAAITTGVDQLQQSIGQLQGVMKDLADAYSAQETVERKLETTMRNTMGATADEAQAIKDLCSAQQELGVIGDEVQLAGAQEMATYLGEKRSLEALIPVMNDMLAQQYGLNATQENAAQIATMLGKVMNGQVGALSRYGYSFDAAQEQVLKFGTESERAAVLVDVISESVGGMNAELTKTDIGKQKQLENTLGDIKEQLGALVQPAQAFVTLAANTTLALSGILKLATSAKTATAAIQAMDLKTKSAALGMLALGLKTQHTDAVTRIFSATMKSGAYSATAFKLALRGLLITTGVGAAIAGLTMLIEYFMNAADDASESVGELEDATEAYKGAAANAQVEIDKETKNLQNLMKANKDTSTAVEHLNKTYGDIFGRYQTASDWYDVLTKKSKAYVKQIGFEAQAQILATKIAEKQIQLESDYAKRKEMWQQGKARTKVTQTYVSPSGYANSYTYETDSDEYKKIKQQDAQLIKEINDLQKQLGIAEKHMTEASNELASIGGAADGTSRSLSVNAMTWQQVSDAISETEKKLKNTTDGKAIKELKAYNEQLQRRKKILDSQLGLNSQKTTKPTTSKPTKEDSPVLPEKLENIKDYGDAIAYWKKQQETASREEYANIQRTIDALEAERDAFIGVEKAQKQEAEEYKPKGIDKLHTIEELENEIAYYQDLQKKQSSDEIQNTQKTINALEAKKKAMQRGVTIPSMQHEIEEINGLNGRELKLKIKGMGFEELTSKINALQKELKDLDNPVTAGQRKDIEGMIATYESWRKQSVNTFDTYRQGWDGIKGIGGGIEGITQALEGNGNAWQKTIAIVDGFISIYDGIKEIVTIIELLSTATTAHTVAKAAESAAVIAETTSESEGAVVNETVAESQTPVIAANKLATASYMELAAAEYMAAHAYIPFAGFGIGAGFASSAVAMVEAIGLMPFANGGVISGPVIGLMGEYAGASNNPEVVAPLDKLRSMIEPNSGPEELTFRLKGSDLYATWEKRQHKLNRS